MPRMVYYVTIPNRKEVHTVSKQKKKPKKTVDYATILLTALMDLVIGLVLLIVDKLLSH